MYIARPRPKYREHLPPPQKKQTKELEQKVFICNTTVEILKQDPKESFKEHKKGSVHEDLPKKTARGELGK